MRVTQSVRRVAALGIALVASLGLAAAVSGPAGAQTTATTPCSYTVSPVRLPPGGGTVTVNGTAPGDAEVRIFADGVFVVSTRTDAVTGAFSVSFVLSQTSEIGVSIDDYPATGCAADVGGQRASRGSLARTGGSNINSTVLLGLALVLVGTVLVVAVRRRDRVRGRT